MTVNDGRPYLPQETIIKKRNGQHLNRADIARFVAGITDGSVTDAQIAAFGMAIFLNGMDPDEGADLTRAMRDSGTVLDWRALGFDEGAPIVDKHSTGGVGDKVSLMLAPIVAAAGGYVPMISGRGLGHTGGTLDKLDAIPGYDSLPNTDRFAAIVKDVGCSIIGQTAQLAPADKRFYAVRDVTGTVESIELITASILSKKLAAGLGSLVMDVKFGNGAFMAASEDAEELAKNIVRVASAAETPIVALLTDMNQVLGRTAGNAIEVLETLDFLRDPQSADYRLLEVTTALAAHMLHISGVFGTLEAASNAASEVLISGKAADVFARMVTAHGGPADLFEKADVYLPLAAHSAEIPASEGGYIAHVDTRRLGMLVVALGGGRTDPGAAIDPSVGLGQIRGVGEKLEAGDPLLRVYAADKALLEYARTEVQACYSLVADPVPSAPVILKTIAS